MPGKGGLGSTKFVAFETQAWHNECFFCHQCKVSMVGKGFIQVSFILILVLDADCRIMIPGRREHHLPRVCPQQHGPGGGPGVKWHI